MSEGEFPGTVCALIFKQLYGLYLWCADRAKLPSHCAGAVVYPVRLVMVNNHSSHGSPTCLKDLLNDADSLQMLNVLLSVITINVILINSSSGVCKGFFPGVIECSWGPNWKDGTRLVWLTEWNRLFIHEPLMSCESGRYPFGLIHWWHDMELCLSNQAAY